MRKGGFEPPTSRLSAVRYTRLSHSRVVVRVILLLALKIVLTEYLKNKWLKKFLTAYT